MLWNESFNLKFMILVAIKYFDLKIYLAKLSSCDDYFQSFRVATIILKVAELDMTLDY